MVSNYQLLVELKLQRNPVASIDKITCGAQNCGEIQHYYQWSQINGEIQEVLITVEAHIYGEIQHN